MLSEWHEILVRTHGTQKQSPPSLSYRIDYVAVSGEVLYYLRDMESFATGLMAITDKGIRYLMNLFSCV